jgi:ankyrin repeat protein
MYMKRALLLLLTAGSITQAMEENLKTITGDLFIVPSGLVRVDCEPSPEWLKETRLCNITSIGDKKVSIQKGDYLVEVWATDRKNAATLNHRSSSSNWAAHGHPDLNQRKHFVFPHRLPVTALQGKNEGDVVTMDIQQSCKMNMPVHAILHCAQNAYKYDANNTGAKDFQSLLARLLANAKKRDAQFDDIPEPSAHVMAEPKPQSVKILSKQELFALRTNNGDTRTPLLCAVIANQQDVVRCLLEQNANPNEVSNEVGTPFRAAIMQKNMGIMSLLVEHSANINSNDLNKTSNFGSTLLHYLADKSYDMAARDIRLLLSWGARQDIANDCGEYPIHIASRTGRIENVNAFLDFASDGSKELSEESEHTSPRRFRINLNKPEYTEPRGWGLI